MDFYLRTTQVLDRVRLAQSSLKADVSALATDPGDAKRLLALSVSCLSYKPTLDELVSFAKRALLNAPKDWKVFEAAASRAAVKSSHGHANPKADTLLLVLIYDLVLSPKKQIQASASWPPHALLVKHKTRLRAELTRMQIRAGKSRVEDLRLGGDDRERAERIPRWARVNEGKVSVKDVVAHLKSEGWKRASGPHLAKGRNFVQSSFIPSLLAFHPSSTSALLSHELYTSGKLILQDLASCFPAQILAADCRNRSIEAIDATAAPGNKTSHLSALLGYSGTVTAFELSPQRYQTLTSQLNKSGCLADVDTDDKNVKKRKRAEQADVEGTRNVHALRADFLETDPDDARWQGVELMLLDPSCSGSGIVNRLDYLSAGATSATDEQEEDASLPATSTSESSKPGSTPAPSTSALSTRLASLAAFQLTMIKHAMRFPALRRIVYSTCSVHAEEDEHVVCEALRSDEARAGGWKLMRRERVLPAWPVRGRVEECGGDCVIAESVIRCLPGGDPSRIQGVPPGSVHVEASNGFFVVAFERESTQADKGTARSPTEDAGENNAAASPVDGLSSTPRKKRKKKKKNKKGNQGEVADVH